MQVALEQGPVPRTGALGPFTSTCPRSRPVSAPAGSGTGRTPPAVGSAPQEMVHCCSAEPVFACWVTSDPLAVEAVVSSRPLLAEATV